MNKTLGFKLGMIAMLMLLLLIPLLLINGLIDERPVSYTHLTLPTTPYV